MSQEQTTGIEEPRPPVTKEERDRLPYDVVGPYWNHNHTTLYVEWHGQDVYTSDLEAWYIDTKTNNNDDNPFITPAHWEEHYPGYLRIKEINQRNLEGFYNGKKVCWSKTKKRWIYFNRRPVEFTQETLSEEERQVGDILKTTAHTLERLTQTVRQSTPEHRTPETLPGDFPVTPEAFRLLAVTALPTPGASGSGSAPRYARTPSPRNTPPRVPRTPLPVAPPLQITVPVNSRTPSSNPSTPSPLTPMANPPPNPLPVTGA